VLKAAVPARESGMQGVYAFLQFLKQKERAFLHLLTFLNPLRKEDIG